MTLVNGKTLNGPPFLHLLNQTLYLPNICPYLPALCNVDGAVILP